MSDPYRSLEVEKERLMEMFNKSMRDNIIKKLEWAAENGTREVCVETLYPEDLRKTNRWWQFRKYEPVGPRSKLIFDTIIELGFEPDIKVWCGHFTHRDVIVRLF